MIRRFALLLLPLVAVACEGRPLPVATGPVRPLNVGRWTPGPNDLTAPPDPVRPVGRVAAPAVPSPVSPGAATNSAAVGGV